LTESHRRTLMTILTGLAEAGLAECDEHGRWHRTGSTLSVAVRQEVAAARREVRVTVAAERQTYRAARRTPGWEVARAAAVKAQRAKSAGWWTSLPQEERAQRAETLSRRFAALSVQEQLQQKTLWAQRDVRAGVDPRARHDGWLAAQSDEEFAQRTAARQAAYEALPQPARIAAVQAWDAYRDAWGVARGIVAEGVRHAPPGIPEDTRAERDELFLQEAARGRARYIQDSLAQASGDENR
ncbi:MAG: hypothetical protein L0G89_00370, partial [Janibacter sp.]|nr:hypothetical protein [Janibacter sp.]